MEHGSTIQGTLKEVARGNPANRRYRTAKNKEMNFRKDVMILEYHYLKLEEAYKYQGGNIIWHYFKFGCGILGYAIYFLEDDVVFLQNNATAAFFLHAGFCKSFSMSLSGNWDTVKSTFS